MLQGSVLGWGLGGGFVLFLRPNSWLLLRSSFCADGCTEWGPSLFFFKVIFVQKEQKGGGALEGELPTLPAEDRTPSGAALFLCTCAWPYPLPAFGAVWDSHLYFHSRY